MKQQFDTNPTLSISNGQKFFVACATGLWLAFILLNAATSNDFPLFTVAASVSLKVLLFLSPFLLFSEKLGLLHPLVFPPLWTVLNMMLRNTETYLGGLSGHTELTVNAASANYLFSFHEILTAASFTFIVLGFLVTPNLKLGFRFSSAGSWLFTKTCVIGAISSAAFLVWVKLSGGIQAVLLSRAVPKAERLVNQIGGHYVVFCQIFTFGLMLYVAYKPRVVQKLYFWLLLVASVGLTFASSGSRSRTIYPVVIVFIIYIVRTQKIPYVKIAIFAACGLVALGFMSVFRYSQFGNETIDTDKLTENNPVEAIQYGFSHAKARSGSSHGGMPILQKVPHEVPLLYGKSYLSIFTLPIPSALLPFEKFSEIGRYNGDIMFQTDASIPSGAVAEAFWNFHLIGIPLVFFLWGAFLKTIYSLYKTNFPNPTITCIYVLTIFYGTPETGAFFTLFTAIGSVIFCAFIYTFPKLPVLATFRQPQS